MLQATIQDAGPLLQVKGKCTKNQSPLQGGLQGTETLNCSKVYTQISNYHKHTAFIPLDHFRRPPLCAMRNFRVSFRETNTVVAKSNVVAAVIIVVQKPNKHNQN
jgi:hypothetical protein